MKLFWIAFSVSWLSVSLMAQTSLWKNHNPYVSSVQTGDILEIIVNEEMLTNVDAKWEQGNKVEMKLYPDTKTLPFLTGSEQSKSRSRNNSVRFKVKDGIHFKISGLVGEPQNNGRAFIIRAAKNIQVDGKPAQVQLSGLFDPRQVKARQISSSQLAELTVSILSQPPLPRDTSIQLKPPADPTQPNAVNTAELSEQEKQTILLRHLQEILGGLNQ